MKHTYKQIDKDGNYIALDLDIIGLFKCTLINLYGPSKDHTDFYDGIKNIIKGSESGNLILSGDWNAVLDQKKDCLNYKGINNPGSTGKIQNIIDEFDLIDIWRLLNPDQRQYT